MEPRLELPSYLIKPIQRICKYPLLLRELIRFTENSSSKEELKRAMAVSERVAQAVNEIRRKEENLKLVTDLEKNVEDWKVFLFYMKAVLTKS
jgi:cell division control protein 24